MLKLAILLLAIQAPADPIAAYLQRCEAARAARRDSLQADVERLSKIANPSPEQTNQRSVAIRELEALAGPAPFLPIAMPPAKDDVGIFPTIAAAADRGEISVDVLEIFDEDDCVVRAWHLPPPGARRLVAGVPTFVDLWVHGVETAALSVGKPAQLKQVFQAVGPKSFDTTCGSRSIPQVVPVAISR